METMAILTGKNLVAGTASAQGVAIFRASDPQAGRELEPNFVEATTAEIDEAAKAAEAAFEAYRSRPASDIAAFLERIAENLGAVGDALIDRAHQETALPQARLTGELARTRNQILMFAALVKQGDWLDARIDRAIPDRKPLPKPDLRRMLIPIGPVAVWAASNFPLAFSVAGGDTASAFAAGNPVVVKAHPAHPGSSEIAANAIARAVEASGLPAGVFSMLHGRSPEVSLALVRHPAIKAAGFTGSLRAGRALFDAASARPEPIPFFAEMGSVNPVFILPKAAEQQAEQIADGLFNSVCLGVGQFCTNPGVAAVLDSPAADKLAQLLSDRFRSGVPGSMLYRGIRDQYENGLGFRKTIAKVTATLAEATSDAGKTQGAPVLFQANAAIFLANHVLREELFGPSTILVRCGSAAELEQVARELSGNLTATLLGTPEDLLAYENLVRLLETKVGRVIVNGYPTGVEVCPAMQHGGPYPATTDSRFTSVGTAAIQRFARPVCYQNLPESLLPIELRDANERGILRIVDGRSTRESLS